MARTLFDLCGAVQARRAERALDTALARKLVTLPPLWRVLIDLAEHGDATPIHDEMRDVLLAGADDAELGGDVLTQRLEGPDEDGQALALHGLADEGDLQRAIGISST